MRCYPLVIAVALFSSLHLSGGQKALAESAPATFTPAETLPDSIEKYVIATKSKEYPKIAFYLRVPECYRQHPEPKKYRVLLSCPVFNGDGLKNLESRHELTSVADARGWFMIAPTFIQDRKEVRDRKLSYYYPEGYSGKAVLDVLDLVQKKYPIASDGLFLHGFSGGAQFVHRFAIWAPERVAAVVVNSSSWFDEPNARCQQTGWLVTIGESDPSYENTLAFVQQLKDYGTLPVFRSYLAMTHERIGKTALLDVEFLKFYDDLTLEKLGAKHSFFAPKLQPIVPAAQMPFMADTQRWRYFKSTSEAAKQIDSEELIYLPSETIAKTWGTAEEDEK